METEYPSKSENFQLGRLARFRGKLQTRDRLAKFRIVNDSICPFCHVEDKSSNHLFCSFIFTNEVWRLANLSQLGDRSCGIITFLRKLFLDQPYDPDLFAKTLNYVVLANLEVKK